MKNKVQLIGHLGELPVITELPNTLMATLQMATTETYKNEAGEKVTEQQWHRVICFGKLAEICRQYLVASGMEIAVEGRLINCNYLDQKGIKQFATQVHAGEVLILTSRV